MGRMKLPQLKKYSRVITLRAKPPQLARWRKTARKQGVSITTWIRSVLDEKAGE